MGSGAEIQPSGLYMPHLSPIAVTHAATKAVLLSTFTELLQSQVLLRTLILSG